MRSVALNALFLLSILAASPVASAICRSPALAFKLPSEEQVVYRTTGRAVERAERVLIFLNGIDKDMAQWDSIVLEVAKSHPTWALVQVDLLGQGRTSRVNQANLAAIDYRRQIGALNGLIRELQLEKNEIVLVGHSYGGGIAARYAREMSGLVSDVILIAPFVDHLELYQPGLSPWLSWVKDLSERGGLGALYDFNILASSSLTMMYTWPLNSFFRLSTASLIDVLNLTLGIRNMHMTESVQKATGTQFHMFTGLWDEMIPLLAHENLWAAIPPKNRGLRKMLYPQVMYMPVPGHELPLLAPSAVVESISQALRSP